MTRRGLLNNFGLLCCAFFINALLFMGIAFLCREDAPDRAMTVASPIHLVSTESPAPTRAAVSEPATHAEPQPFEKVSEIPRMPQQDEPEVAPERPIEFEVPELHYDMEPELQASMKVPQPIRRPRPKKVVKNRAVKRPERKTASTESKSKAKPADDAAAISSSASVSSAAAGDSAAGGTLRGEFGLDEVDRAPQIIEQKKPAYPLVARRRNLTGKVTVKFLVDCHGKVRKPQILDAHPRGVFEQSVLDSVTKWRFKPGMYRGQKVATWVVLPVQFKLTGG